MQTVRSQQQQLEADLQSKTLTKEKGKKNELAVKGGSAQTKGSRKVEEEEEEKEDDVLGRRQTLKTPESGLSTGAVKPPKPALSKASDSNERPKSRLLDLVGDE